MAGESTNPPSGPGSNPGGVPINDQGAAMPNPAPPPPSSLPPKPKSIVDSEAEAVFDEFVEIQKKINEEIQKYKSNLVSLQEADKKLVESTEARQRADKTAKDEAEALARQYAEFRGEGDSWLEGTENLQLAYKTGLKEIAKAHRDAIHQERDAQEKRKKLFNEVETQHNEAVSGFKRMNDLTNTMETLDEELAKDLHNALQQIDTGVGEVTVSLETYFKEGAKEFVGGLKAVTEKLKKEQITLDAKREAREVKSQKRKDQEAATAASVEMMKQAGGVGGADEIKKYINDFLKVQIENFKELKPDATEQEVEDEITRILEESNIKEEVHRQMTLDNNEEQIKVVNKAVERLMEEKGLERSVAARLVENQRNDKSSDIYKELKVIKERGEQSLKFVRSMDKTSLRTFSIMSDKQAMDLQVANETAQNSAKAFDNLGDRISYSIESMKDRFSSLFGKDKSSSWLKMILIVLTVVVGATLGYIWAKIKLIVGLLGYIPGIGKYITNGFKTFTGLFDKGKSISGFIAKMLNPLKSIFKVLGTIFPTFAGFGGRLAGIFMKAFRFLGPVGVVITTLYDVIFGAVKGFKEMGIKGIIMGAIAGILSGLTFGLVDFKTIFDGLKKYFGKFFEAINKVFGAILWIFQPFIDAFKKIVAIFKGEGSIVSKIFMALWESIKATIMTWFRFILAFAYKIPLIVLNGIIGLVEGVVKLIWGIVKWGVGMLVKAWTFIYIEIPMMIIDGILWIVDKLAEGIIFVWDWFASGEWLGDLKNLGNWLWQEITSLFGGMWNSVADAFGEIPWIGDAIKGFLGGGSGESEESEGLKTAVEEAADTADKLVTESQVTKESMLNIPPGAVHPLTGKPIIPEVSPLPLATGEMVAVPMSTASAAQVTQASAQASSAQFAAQKSGGHSTAINAPTTNVVSSGGGESAVLMPSLSRNNDPTFRALLFLEQPAL